MNLAILSAAALGAWIYLTLFRGGFWRASERLAAAADPQCWPDIVAVIPARDEAPTIGAVVSAHLESDYPGKLLVIVVDDGSIDGTADIARKAAENDPSRLEIVTAPELEPGWTGKLWAVHQGLRRARELSPDASYVLLTDADIVPAKETLRNLVAKSEAENLALASLMARLDTKGTWAALLIPAFIYFFQKLYPFPLINDPQENTAGAAGGCMLVRTEPLHSIGGVESIRNALIDDCSLARKIKDTTPSTKIWLGLADKEATSLRKNETLKSIWDMVARSAYAQLGYSPLLLVGSVLGMMLVYLAAPLILLTFTFHWSMIATYYAIAAWGLMAFTYWPTLKLYDRPPWEVLFLPVAATLYLAMTISSALRHWNGQGGQWKGRTY